MFALKISGPICSDSLTLDLSILNLFALNLSALDLSAQHYLYILDLVSEFPQ